MAPTPDPFDLAELGEPEDRYAVCQRCLGLVFQHVTHTGGLSGWLHLELSDAADGHFAEVDSTPET